MIPALLASIARGDAPEKNIEPSFLTISPVLTTSRGEKKPRLAQRAGAFSARSAQLFCGAEEFVSSSKNSHSITRVRRQGLPGQGTRVVKMPNRPVHWYEGMFLRPHHFQAADRNQRTEARTAEDWFHPFNWGLRAVDLDRDAIANSTFVLRSCEVRFKDGTKLSVPADAAIDSVDLREALAASQNGDVIVSLGVPSARADRANVEPRPTADGPRFWVETIECIDENTGGDEQEIEFKRVRCRLLLSGQDATGYEVMPLARVERSSQAEAAPQLDYAFVPPLLVIDAWPPLWRSIQALHYQISARIEQLASQAVDRGLSFDSQVPGDAERLLKLSVLNGAFSYFESAAYLKGLHPLQLYQELCRLVGQLAIFTENRRPVNSAAIRPR